MGTEKGFFASYALFGKIPTLVPWVQVDFPGQDARLRWELDSGVLLRENYNGVSYISTADTNQSLQFDRDSWAIEW